MDWEVGLQESGMCGLGGGTTGIRDVWTGRWDKGFNGDVELEDGEMSPDDAEALNA